jgi:alcohol dehydrogenase
MTMSISSFFCPTRLYLGLGSHQILKDIFKQYGAQRVFIALDAALIHSNFFAQVQALLVEQAIAYKTFTDIEPDPSAITVAKAFDACSAHQATLLLAIGGGSTIDVAKAVGILATNGGRIHDYEGVEKFANAPLPLIVIPTTAGTGSEVSGSCVITDTEKQRKMSIRHASLNPAAVAILDPLAVRTVPGHVAAHSGMDAFVHAFESYLSRQANAFTDAINLHALELISGNLRQFVSNRENTASASNMLYGSALAGITFGQTGLGNVHCMARFVGASLHLSHGLSNAICLPHVARFNMLANPEKYSRIAVAMGRQVQGMSTLDAAKQAVLAIDELCNDLGIPKRLRDLGAIEEDFDEMALQCLQADYNRWNPRHTTQADFRQLLQRAF